MSNHFINSSNMLLFCIPTTKIYTNNFHIIITTITVNCYLTIEKSNYCCYWLLVNDQLLGHHKLSLSDLNS